MCKGTLFFAHMQIYSYLCSEIYEPRSKGRNFLDIWQMKNNSSWTN